MRQRRRRDAPPPVFHPLCPAALRAAQLPPVRRQPLPPPPGDGLQRAPDWFQFLRLVHGPFPFALQLKCGWAAFPFPGVRHREKSKRDLAWGGGHLQAGIHTALAEVRDTQNPRVIGRTIQEGSRVEDRGRQRRAQRRRTRHPGSSRGDGGRGTVGRRGGEAPGRRCVRRSPDAAGWRRGWRIRRRPAPGTFNSGG